MIEPWVSIDIPESGTGIVARRVDAANPFGYFWARDDRGRCLFIMQYSSGTVMASAKLPELSGIKLADIPDPDDAELRRLSFSLLESENVDIFHQLCNDLMSATEGSRSEAEALRKLIKRTSQWHYLLKGKRSDRLSPEAQMGLVGELLFLQQLLGCASADAALDSWTGPAHSARDFVFSETALEVKISGPKSSTISISSAEQLDRTGLDDLFIVVWTLATSDSPNSHSVSLPGLVSGLEKTFESAGDHLVSIYHQKLADYGFQPNHDYSKSIWDVLGQIALSVGPGFPCLTPATIPPGIVRLSYVIDTTACASFEIDMEEVLRQIPIANHA